MRLKLRGNRLIVKLPKTEKKLDSGLWIPDQLQEIPHEGIVMQKGPDCKEDFNVWDRVKFEDYAGLDITDPNYGEVVLLEERDLQAVIGD